MDASISALHPAIQGALRSSIAISSLWQAVEECMSNSLDSGADEVHVEVNATEFSLKVVDNGAGVPLADLHLLGTRHATSKAQGGGPCGAPTLGGHGEALAAMCLASVVEVTSRARGCFETHTCLLRGGAVLKTSLALEQRPRPGTTLVVRDLLYNRPVARKAIINAGLAREVDRCCEVAARLALTRPHVTFTLFDQGRKAFLMKQIKGRSQLESIHRFFGHPPADAVATVCSPPEPTGDLGACGVGGWVVLPPHGYPTTSKQWIYINGIFARAPHISKAVGALFAELYPSTAQLDPGTQLHAVRKASNRHPMFVLQLRCAPASLDVVPDAAGPTALFAEWEPVLHAVCAAVKEAWRPALRNSMLAGQEAAREAAAGHSRGGSRHSAPPRLAAGSSAGPPQPGAAAQHAVAVANFRSKRPASYSGLGPAAAARAVRFRNTGGSGRVTSGGLPTRHELQQDAGSGSNGEPPVLPDFSPVPLEQLAQWQQLAADPQRWAESRAADADVPASGTASWPQRRPGQGAAPFYPPAQLDSTHAGGAHRAGPPAQAHKPTPSRPASGLDLILSSWHNPVMLPPAAGGPAASPVLSLEAAEAQAFARLRPVALVRCQLQTARALRQVDCKFIPVVCGGGVLAAVDQHAADERVQLERLRAEVVGPGGMPAALPAPSLLLPVPQPLALASGEGHLLETWGSQAAAWGWQWVPAGPALVAVTHVPLVCNAALTATDLRLYLHRLQEASGAAGPPPGVTRVLNSKACRGALMFGDELLPAQCAALVQALQQTRLCFVCAHGRPTTAPLVDLRALRQATGRRGGGGGGREAAPLKGLKRRLTEALWQDQ